MANLNPLQRHLASRHPSPAAGQGGTVRLPIEGITNLDLLKRLVEAADRAGHLTIERRPMGSFGYRLTEAGAEFLAAHAVR